MSTVAVFASAATAFAALVRAVPAPAWDGPGIGDWDLRSLIGHASRSMITVSTYLESPAEYEDITSPADYYARMLEYSSGVGADAVTERGRQAGRDLGEHPVAAIDALVTRVLEQLAAVDDPLIEVIGRLGIHLRNYLPTRVFELAVHGLDIVRATGVDFIMPDDVLADAAALAAQIGVSTGQGETLLLALTGRVALPDAFSVV